MERWAYPESSVAGLFTEMSGHTNWFVEYNQGYAARFGESLFWAGDSSAEMPADGLIPDAEVDPPRSYELNRGGYREVLFPLDAPIRAARGLVVQSLITQVERIASLLQKPDHS